MNIKTHHSGSSGNLYQVDDILIDPGVPIKKIREVLHFRLSDISGCLLSHSHGDHAKGAKDIMKAGIDLYCGPETAEALKLSGHRLYIINSMRQFQIGKWKIKPFPLIHDVENFGFLIANGEEKILYAIDTNYVPFRFNGLTAVMLGIDYDTEILKRNLASGNVNLEMAKRTLGNHMSLDTAKEFFRVNDMSRVREVYLLHLSNSNSDENLFKNEIQKITGVPVYV